AISTGFLVTFAQRWMKWTLRLIRLRRSRNFLKVNAVLNPENLFCIGLYANNLWNWRPKTQIANSRSHPQSPTYYSDMGSSSLPVKPTEQIMVPPIRTLVPRHPCFFAPKPFPRDDVSRLPGRPPWRGSELP